MCIFLQKKKGKWKQQKRNQKCSIENWSKYEQSMDTLYVHCVSVVLIVLFYSLFMLSNKHTHTYTMHLWLYLLCRWFYLPDTFFNFSYFQFVVASSLLRFSFSFLLSSLRLFIHSSWLFIRYISLVGFSYVFFFFFFFSFYFCLT